MVEVIGVGGECIGGGWCVGGGCAGEGRAGEGRAGEGRAGEGRADECCVGAYACFGKSCCSGNDPVVDGVGSGQSSTAVDASDPTDAGVAGSLDPPLPSTERFDSPGAAKRNPGP